MPDEQPIELGQEPQQEPQVPLDVKYREQMRQIIPQKIELPISTLPGMIEKQIKLNPEFQRRDRWSVDQQSRFIESIIMNVPIPPVFLGEDDYGNYVVLDGRQRLTAVYDFMKNRYALRGLTVWAELNGLQYLDLEKKRLDRTITRRFIPAVVILKESSPEVKYDVFDRLNTGGAVAVEMEIRNAVYPGKFNRLLHRLSDDPTFREIWRIPTDDVEREKSPIYRKMTDLELVLRFFALRDPDQMDRAFKDYLSAYMGRRNREYEQDASLEAQDEGDFKRAVENTKKIFGPTAFQRATGPKSAPLADAIMTSLSKLRPERVEGHLVAALRTALTELISNPEFEKAITSGTNGKGAIRTRIALAQERVRATAPHDAFV